MMRMDKDRLIDDLAAELGASEAARKKWRQRGIPHRWRIPLIEAAAERGITLVGGDFDRCPQKSAAA